jgi:hypothetical protein
MADSVYLAEVYYPELKTVKEIVAESDDLNFSGYDEPTSGWNDSDARAGRLVDRIFDAAKTSGATAVIFCTVADGMFAELMNRRSFPMKVGIILWRPLPEPTMDSNSSSVSNTGDTVVVNGVQIYPKPAREALRIRWIGTQEN